VKEDEAEMLTLSTNHRPKSYEHLSLFLTSSKPLPKVSNPKIRAFKKWNLDTSKGFPLN